LQAINYVDGVVGNVIGLWGLQYGCKEVQLSAGRNPKNFELPQWVPPVYPITEIYRFIVVTLAPFGGYV
jgi:hypothetical protein